MTGIDRGQPPARATGRLGRLRACRGASRSVLRATVEMDEAGRARLASIHNEIIDELRELVSEELRSELDALELEQVGDGVPTGGKLRVVQAQLTGWLQGLFQGIQASVASQQLAAQQQLARMQRQKQLSPGSSGPTSGQYL